MNQMTGIILMIIGILNFVGGIIIYNSSKKIKAENKDNIELNDIIEIAIADGVLTNNEREVLNKIATNKNLDNEIFISEVEKQLAESKITKETKLINYKKKNGDDFEKFIVQKFNKEFFRIKEWAGDKYIKGFYADTTQQPDLMIELKYKKDVFVFSVECKWRQNLFKKGIEFAKKEQFNRYKDFEKTNNIPVFLAIGIGGKAEAPASLFIIPLKEIDNNFIHINELEKYRKTVNSKFFFDVKTNKLT